MTDAKKILRALIILSVALLIAHIAVAGYEYDALPSIYRYYATKMLVENNTPVAARLGVFAASLIAMAGLFFFKNWARYLFAACFVANAALVLLFLSFGQAIGLYVTWTDQLLGWHYVCGGAILACVFLPSARALFPGEDKQTKTIGSANQQ